MTIVKSLPLQPSSATNTDVDLWKLDRTKWVLDGPVKQQGRIRIQAYAFDDGDVNYPLRGQVKQQLDDAKAANARQRNTISCHPTLKKADSVAETEEAMGECDFGIFFNVPLDNSLPKEDVYKWLTAAFALAFKTVSGGVGDTDTITSLYRRILAVL